MLNMFSLQGNYEPQFDTEETLFRPNVIDTSMKFAKNLRDVENFSIFYDSILVFLKMIGSSEFDEYRQIICSELLRDITSSKSTERTHENLLNKIVQQMGYDFNLENKQEMKQTYNKTLNNGPKLGI